MRPSASRRPAAAAKASGEAARHQAPAAAGAGAWGATLSAASGKGRPERSALGRIRIAAAPPRQGISACHPPSGHSAPGAAKRAVSQRSSAGRNPRGSPRATKSPAVGSLP